ncbi:MAG: MFS transporter, partial [Lachnospiraceae bacterium]|nr:MFS transporter [Lachnospiraceae bacterium]
MNIKKQTFLLYLYDLLISFRLIDTVWVLFLLDRGYTLAQVGIAEGVFHITSMLFEIPSGMFADLFGRKKTLLLSGTAGILSSFFMALDGW